MFVAQMNALARSRGCQRTLFLNPHGLDSLERRLLERAMPAKDELPTGSFSSKVEETKAGFLAAMEDDFNTAAALGRLYTFVSETNVDLEAGRLLPADAAAARTLVENLAGGILGVLPFQEAPGAQEAASSAGDAEVEARIAARQEARKRRDFKAADAIRDELAAIGIVLEDTPKGVRWHRRP